LGEDSHVTPAAFSSVAPVYKRFPGFGALVQSSGGRSVSPLLSISDQRPGLSPKAANWAWYPVPSVADPGGPPGCSEKRFGPIPNGLLLCAQPVDAAGAPELEKEAFGLYV